MARRKPRSSQLSRAHHYIPRLILNGFAPGMPGSRRARMLHRFDKVTGEMRLLSTKRAAFVDDLYTLPPEAWPKADALEQSFTFLETLVGPHIHRLRSLTQSGHYPLDPSLRDGLAGFVAMLHVRSPTYRDTANRRITFLASIDHDMQLSNPEAVREALRAAGDTRTDDEIEAARLQELEDFRSGRIFLEAQPIAGAADVGLFVDRVRPLLRERRFVLLRRDRWPLFVIGDQPVTLRGPDAELGDIGFGIPDNDVLVPLGSRTLLVMTSGDHEDEIEVRAADALDSDGLLGPWWHEVNVAAWRTAGRFVYGRSRADLDAVRLALDPSTRQATLPGMSVEGGPPAWAGYAERLGIRYNVDDGPLIAFHASDPNRRPPTWEP